MLVFCDNFIYYSDELLAVSTSNPTPGTVMPQLPPEPAGRCSNKLQVFKKHLFSDVFI